MKKNDADKKDLKQQIRDFEYGEKEFRRVISQLSNEIAEVKRNGNKKLLKEYALLKEENNELRLRFSTEDLKSHIKKYMLKSLELKSDQTTEPADVQQDIGQVRPEDVNDGPNLHNTINIGQFVSVSNSENACGNENFQQGRRVRDYQQLSDSYYNPKAEARCYSPGVEDTWDSYYFPPYQDDTYYDDEY